MDPAANPAAPRDATASSQGPLIEAFRLKDYPLDLIKRHVVRSAIIELRRARAGVVRHQSRIFKRSAELPKHRDPRRPE